MRENKLNHLDGKEWVKFTKSWFVHNPPPRSKKEKLHPAKFPEDMVQEFIEFFTKKGQMVLDPFAGTGSTLVAAHDAERNGVGVELQKKYVEIARERIDELEENGTEQKIVVGDALEVDELVDGEVDFVITSPPYGPMLNKKGLAQKKREEEELDTNYSDEDTDIGNIEDYDAFVGKLADIFKKVKNVLKERGYLVIVIQNYRDGSVYRTLAWDVAKALEGDYTLSGERLWLQDNKPLYPYGYRYAFVPNVHHHYCLVLRNE